MLFMKQVLQRHKQTHAHKIIHIHWVTLLQYLYLRFQWWSLYFSPLRVFKYATHLWLACLSVNGFRRPNVLLLITFCDSGLFMFVVCFYALSFPFARGGWRRLRDRPPRLLRGLPAGWRDHPVRHLPQSISPGVSGPRTGEGSGGQVELSSLCE